MSGEQAAREALARIVHEVLLPYWPVEPINDGTSPVEGALVERLLGEWPDVTRDHPEIAGLRWAQKYNNYGRRFLPFCRLESEWEPIDEPVSSGTDNNEGD